MFNSIIKCSLRVLIALPVIFLMACGTSEDDGSEGGVIGSGLILNGTVTDVRMFASNTLLIKARTGEVSRAVIDDTGNYQAPDVAGSPPYLLRADLGNNEYRYGVAFDNGIANVHSYTDVIMRNWFASGNGNIDFEFEQQAFTTALPSPIQFRNNANDIFSYVQLVLESYQLSGEQLLSADYNSRNNNFGIDSFLRKNAMFIEDERIALVITDPVTENQSTTRLGFSVFELTSDADNEPPEEPRSVRALPSASNEIVLVWEPALDNKGVVGYDVYRERELIATTPYPVLIDTGLEPDLLYTYEVIAFDASNNRSATSIPATSGTLGEPDTLAPPAPVQLSATANIGRMNLLWGQSNIGDVVEFDVYRGIFNNSVEFLTTVTSSIHTDVTVSSGAQYCYQVVAVDAAGNESSRSTEACETAVGNVVERLANEPEPVVPLLAGLSIPDTENMACENEWANYEIDNSVSISAGCYLVEESIEIDNGGSLRLSPGAILKFSAGTEVEVNEGGSFAAEGTKAMPVVLTAQDPTPGYWNGVRFSNSNSSRNKLVNSVVEFAGGGNTAAAVSVSAFSSGITRAEITGSVIRSCAGAGISAIDENSIIAKLDGSVITGCDNPLSINAAGLGNVTSRNDFTQNQNDWIDVGRADIRSDMTMDDLGVPYVVTDMRILSGNLLINDGVVLKFREGGDLSISGSMTAVGLEDKPVLFTGTVEQPGHWKGIRVTGKANFEYAEVLYGGLNRSNSDSAALDIHGGELAINHMLIKNSLSYALSISRLSSRLDSVDNLMVRENKKTIEIPFNKLDQLGRSITFDNNEIPEISMSGLTVSNIVLDIYDLGVPYLLTDSATIRSGAVTVHPGVVLLMGAAVEITLTDNAVFNALGTSGSPVLFTSESMIPGAWNGFDIRNRSVGRFEHSVLEYAGGGIDTASGTINMYCDSSASLALANTTIKDSAGWGISLFDNNQCALNIGENVVFSRNSKGEISIP